jgi:uncharacterized membrane protein
MFAITVIIPHFNPHHVYPYWAQAGGGPAGNPESAGALFGSIDTAWPTKLTTVVMLLLPTAFTALGSPVALVAIPSLVLRFISTAWAYWGTEWHYDAPLMPILFIAAAEAIGRWGCFPPLASARSGPLLVLGPLRGLARVARTGAARHGGAMMAAVAVALAFQFPLSALWHGSTYTIGAHVADADAAMAVVPDGVTVTTTVDLLAPLAARTDTFWITSSGSAVTQYVVLDTEDTGDNPPMTNVQAFMASRFKGDGYVQVFARGGVYVYRRG